MFKKLALKKILIITLSLIFLVFIYFFPESDEQNIKTTTTYVDAKTIPIYLIDNNNNLVSRFEVVKKNDDTLKQIDEVIDNLTMNDSKNDYIPNNFKKTIPKNTKIINKDLNDGLLKINFTKEFLNVDLEHEEKLIESIVYSLTEIKDVNKIMIFVEGALLKELPNSKKILPEILDRNYGINKVYELESMKDITKITTYYVSKIDGYSYYTPVTTISNEKQEKVEIIIEKLKSAPTYETNLVSYLSSSAKLLDYQILENSVNLSFNNQILNLNNHEIIEEVKYSIALSIKDTYNINETIFYIDNLLHDVSFI